MKREINVYNFEKRKKRIKEILDTLPPQNKSDIERFCMNLLTEGKSEATYFKYLERLPQIAFLLNKEFKEVTREDLERLFEKLITENSYAKNTIGTYKLMTRRFFQWLYGHKKNQYPSVVEWIEANVHHRKLVRPEDLLTGEDVQKMIAVAFNPRDKAFVAVLAESGCRISEILTLRIRSINFDTHGAVFVVSGKTGDVIAKAHSFGFNKFDKVLLTFSDKDINAFIEEFCLGGIVAYPNGVFPEPEKRSDVDIVGYNGEPDKEIISRLHRYIENGEITPHIDKVFDLDKVQEAHKHLVEHYVGKLAIQISKLKNEIHH
jgi:hypothetical protein